MNIRQRVRQLGYSDIMVFQKDFEAWVSKNTTPELEQERKFYYALDIEVELMRAYLTEREAAFEPKSVLAHHCSLQDNVYPYSKYLCETCTEFSKYDETEDFKASLNLLTGEITHL